MLIVHSLLWRWIKLWAVVRAYIFARRALRGVRPVLFDVGARDGLQQKWHLLARAGVIDAKLFEPDPAEAQRLRARGVPAEIIEKALGDERGAATLHVYRLPGLSSVREVHPDMLRKYDYGEVFDETGQVSIELHRLQDLIAAGEVPAPHFLKVDVQGFEHEILKGLGPKIDGVIGIELEAQFDEMYRDQALFQQIYDWLFAQGFGLVAIRPQWIMGYSLFEVNAFFARNPAVLDAGQQQLRTFWCLLNRISSPQLMAIRGY